MRVGSAGSAKVPAVVERFVKQLVITMKAVKLYPVASSIPRENAREAVAILGEALRHRTELRLSVLKTGLAYEDAIVFEGQQVFESFAQELYSRRLAEVRFHADTNEQDILAFLETVTLPPAELSASGGLETYLWDRGVDTITVTEASTRVVEAGDTKEEPTDADDEPRPPDFSRIDEIIAAALGGRPRDQRVLVRLIGDGQALRKYFSETLTGRGRDPAEMLKDLRIEELAHAVSLVESEERLLLYRNLAEAVLSLDPEIRRAVLVDRMLPGACADNAVAQVVRQMDVDEVCKTLVQGVAGSPAAIEGLTRAIRNLVLISLSERGDVLNAAGAAMLSAGLSQAETEAILEAVSPSRLKICERDSPENANQLRDSILGLIDLAPKMTVEDLERDSQLIALRDEARRGITDGDIVATLASLVAAEPNGASFGSMMALLEDSVELTVARGDYEVAAEVAETLATVLATPDFPADRSARVASVLTRFAGLREIAAITSAMRLYGPESNEYIACMRLLKVLDGKAVEPLLETLADAPDMTTRKALVDLISSIAVDHIDRLGLYLGDSRWYFVRNVVTILGKTKRPEALTCLERTLRHSDSRVRRETIRAISGIKDRLAGEMLIAALDDPDASNVQLAARYLGVSKERGAAEALMSVAAGEGRGNREMGPRAEAIEALGKLGAVEALPLLESLAGRRRLIGGGRVKELRLAAEQAINAIVVQRSGAEGGAG